MKQYVIFFQSKVEDKNKGYFYRNRKEGEYYDFEIKEIYI